MSELDTNKIIKVFYKPKEAAAYLNISIANLNRIIARREIVPNVIGKSSRRISRVELERYLSTR
jgi:excisionase family DNA binding protein